MNPGQTLLHYRLIEKIGEGGMGVVWKAVDTALDREVALKMLPDLFSQDPDRLARFEREARLLASLNHPNIATVHGLHQLSIDSGQTLRFLAMELVEGEDLATRLTRGRLAQDDVLAVSVQIAAALEAAHAQGVVHRDLKPANVMLTADGKVKVLDFGLAKAMAPDAASTSGSLSLSPTMTSAGTAVGMILGTAAYMAPEQARGKPVDRRADLWSFGCVLYECLTGVQLFRGETVSDSLAAILRKDPDWSVLPDQTSPMVRLLLRRCLTRDPAKRMQDAGDTRIELEQAIDDPRGEMLGLAPTGQPGAAKQHRMGWLPWTVAVAAVLFAVFFALRDRPAGLPDTMSHRFIIPIPGLTEFSDARQSPPAISPDGRLLVFGVEEETGRTRLWLRPLDSLDARPLPETEGAHRAFWSPDSRHVGFFQGGQLRRIEVSTGRVRSIGGEITTPRGGSWNARGQIVFAPNSNAGIHVVDAGGGTPRQITTPDPDVPDGSHRWPWFLPDGEHFLFVSWTNAPGAKEDYGGIYLASISGDEPPVRILTDASTVTYASPGYLLVVRGDSLIAVPFDTRERRVTGAADVVATGVQYNRGSGYGAFSTSMDGTLVYAGGNAFATSALTWYDRAGNRSESAVEPGPYYWLRLTPDGDRAAAVLPGTSGDGQIWIVDFTRKVRTPLSAASASFAQPLWSTDAKRLMYSSQHTAKMDLFTRFADGSGDPQSILTDDYDKTLYDWSDDGAYVTEDSGRNEVFVQVFDAEGGGARWQLSTAGGVSPHWRDDGREIVYIDPDQRMMAVSVEQQQGTLVLGPPHELFRFDEGIVAGDVSGDHQRFLAATRDTVGNEPLQVILNWPGEL